MEEKLAKEIFFLKFPNPWREMLIRDYIPGSHDGVGARMSYVHAKLTEWCQQATAQKNIKKLRRINKATPLNCEDNDLPTIIGKEPAEHKKSRKNRFQPYSKDGRSKRRSWKPRTMWSRQKARSYKDGQRSGPSRNRFQQRGASSDRPHERTTTRKTFRKAHARANESFKDCNCWTCGAAGHISTNCPENRSMRRFESTPDIEDAVYFQDLIQVYQFEDIPSDESIYEQNEIFSSEEEEDGFTSSESN